jgi:CelD/BcsL family acetyltransferase involved in cellulose biosynthesis
MFLWGFGERVRLSFIGSGITDYMDLIAAGGYEQACAAAVEEHLGETTQDWDECDLQELRPDSPLLAPGVFEGFSARVETSDVCPVAELAPSMDEHLRQLDPKFRTNLRRSENKLMKAGAVRFLRGPELVHDLIRLHASRWESRGESGVLAGDDLQHFHQESGQRMAEHGLLRLFGLAVDGRCIAVQYNLAAHGCMYAYLSGFDAEWARFSPGAVLLKHSIEDAISEGIHTFDFLRKGEAFKFEWGAIERSNLRLILNRASASAGSSAAL